MRKFWSNVQPSSLSAVWKSATRARASGSASAKPIKTPISRAGPNCSARAPNVKPTTEPPTSATKSRRLTGNPTTGIAGCCARTASGHSRAVLPRGAIKLRRFIRTASRTAYTKLQSRTAQQNWPTNTASGQGLSLRLRGSTSGVSEIAADLSRCSTEQPWDMRDLATSSAQASLSAGREVFGFSSLNALPFRKATMCDAHHIPCRRTQVSFSLRASIQSTSPVPLGW
jgi:hypothetical protein